MEGLKPDDIVRCLNALALMNMQDISSVDIISDLVNDCFIIRPNGKHNSDCDLTELSDDECDPEIGPELEWVLDLEVNGSVTGV